MTKRLFRTPESHRVEKITRDLLPAYLKRRGLSDVEDERTFQGKTISQTISAILPDGGRVKMRVRLCWRPREEDARSLTYAATQLLARITDGDWEGSIEARVENQRRDGVTHLLLVQRHKKEFIHAGIIPLDEVLNVWRVQRDLSDSLIKAGRLGRKKKNHAKNGSSPTLWLHDEAAPSVAEAFWRHPGVVNLNAAIGGGLPTATIHASEDDTYDDLGVDPATVGSDTPGKGTTRKSYVKRDPRVRRLVLESANGICERPKCGETRPFVPFLDVHHILGAEKGDRVHNCVAICPNCHRESHFAPYADALNVELHEIAMARRSPSGKSA